MPGVFIGASIWRNLDVRTATAIFASICSNPTQEPVIWEPMWNDALISRTRSLMATRFLEAPELQHCDVMVIVDDDVVWEAADFWKIVEGCRETRSIYGGVYVTRSHTDPHISSRVFSGSKLRIEKTPERRPLELEYLATGFMAIHRDVLEAMVAPGAVFKDADGTHQIHKVTKGGDRPFWPVFSPFTIEDQPGSFHYLSEDWAFGERARQLGFKAWFDQSIILQHMGLYPYTVGDIGKDFSALPSTGTDQLEVQGRDRKCGVPLIDSLVDDLAEWAEERPGDVMRMMATATGALFNLWNTRGGESEEDWYRRRDVGLLYALDLANWHIAGGCPVMSTLDGTGKRWFDYGSGIGTLGLTAAENGYKVSGYEPNDEMRTFANWRAKKYGLDAEFAGDGIVWRSNFYDVVSCWHVFEHIKDPTIALERIRHILKPGGLLISESGFEDTATPMHHSHPDWEGELRRYGFVKTSEEFTYQLMPVAEAVPA